ncbi:LOW QUALITY PROTEIN: 182 kDa tankyrase-1-binding protein [Cygnus olor]|uniref:LOW QUALITY PROTEIN: 182 kDa tankyrase-1-binding protein n=1 Tax=Cygnus olor TaxID=8869 RepID=UPI001ADE93DF|nr:LOW QUALITY PROTEIN: 182 kDa tankyrase-1-binding protein [Cygnus olor]
MASQPQPLHPPLPCASGGAGLAAGSPEKGTARPKPPIRPKPRVLPKPSVPAKPHPPPGPRHPRPELPSAEKMNRLAGPQPYGGGSSGGGLRRPSFTVKSPETPNGKGLPSPPVSAPEDSGSSPAGEMPAAPPTPSRKGPAPFKVTPVPVATKPERFPGTTVEEILAKMDSKEGPGSPDRARLSPFCPDAAPRFGSKPFAAVFRRRPSGEADGDPPGEAHQPPQHAGGEPGTGGDRSSVAEMSSGSSPAGLSCAGDPRRLWRPPSPPDLSSLQLGTLGPPGSPRSPACPAPAPGAPFQPAEPSALAPGSPDAPPELLAPGSPTLAPGSPDSPAQPPAQELSAASIQAPGAPAEAQLGASRSPGSPHTPSEGSPASASPPTPGTPRLPPRATYPPGSPEAAAEPPAPPSPPLEPPARVSRPPGSPEGPDDSPASPQSPEGPDFSLPPPSRDSGLRRSSEGVLQPPPSEGQGMGELGGSLSALPQPGDPPSERSLGSESSWSLSQSFEWTFPPRGARGLPSPPSSPIREAADSGLSEEDESDGEAAGSRGDGGSHRAGSWAAEGAPCPGGPVAKLEAEGSAEEEEEEEEEEEAEWNSTVLHVTEPDQDPAEPEPPVEATPPDPASPEAKSCWEPGPAGDSPASLQGPGGPGQEESSSKAPDAHPDPGWLTELLASPGARAAGRGSPEADGSEDLLGWSRKDLCSEFGIGRSQRAAAFDWSREAVARDRDWPGEVGQDREFRTKPSWDTSHSVSDVEQQDRAFGAAERDWSSSYKGTELMGDTGLDCGTWPKSHGLGESCLQDQDFGKASWGAGYGLDSAGGREEVSSGKTEWSRTYGVGHGQQENKELSSRQPSWAGRYGSGDPETQDGELAPVWAGEYGTGDAEIKDREMGADWASKYSGRDAESKDEDLTLGWAGRSSTGDTGTLDKEFCPSRSAWDSKYSSRDMESQDREFSPSRPAWSGEYSTQDMESQDREFSPSRPAEASDYSTRDMESQDREFSPSRPAWDSEYSTRAMESQDREFSPSRPAEGGGYGAGEEETQDREFKPSRPAWDDEYSTRDMESRDREFGPGRPVWASEYGSVATRKEDFSPGRLSWAGERGIAQTEAGSAFGVRTEDLPGSSAPRHPSPESGWGSSDQQESGAIGPGGWIEELRLGGAEHHNQFGVIGMDQVPDPSGTAAPAGGPMSWSGEMSSADLQEPGEPPGGWHGDLPVSPSAPTTSTSEGGPGQMAWDEDGATPGSAARPREDEEEEAGWRQHQEAGGWSTELCEAEARRQEWASAFDARCAARSRDFSAGEPSPGDRGASADGRTPMDIRLSDPSPPLGADALAECTDVGPSPQLEPLASEAPRDEDEPSPAEDGDLAAAPPLPEAGGGTPPEAESQEEAPWDHPDGKRLQSCEEKPSQPEGPAELSGQEFTFLEDTEVLDSTVYRSKANLGRKRRHRAPALRPGATSEGDSWIFQDSTEPRPARAAVSSDEEAAEEPKSRRVRASPSGKGVKVPLFPGLNTSALKAKLRGRNRSAEEGALPADSKAAPPKGPPRAALQVLQDPRPGWEAPHAAPQAGQVLRVGRLPPHWLQALKLKKKKS